MHRTTPQFWVRFGKLPEPTQNLARKNFTLLKQDPRHPSLHFKKVGRFWSARVGISYRALAVQNGDDFIWVWIGDHDEYTRLVGVDYLSFTVASRDELEAALQDHNVAHGEILDLGPDLGLYVLAYRDPDNIPLELRAPYPLI